MTSVAAALVELARAIRALGNGNACTEFGAMEAASMKIAEAGTAVAEGLADVAAAIRQVAEKLPDGR